MLQRPNPITDGERLFRTEKMRKKMVQQHIAAVFLGATSNLNYFTGLQWEISERLFGVVITHDRLTYIAPAFEKSRLEELPHLKGDIVIWQEDENPIEKTASFFPKHGLIAIDEAIPLHFYLQFTEVVDHTRTIGANDLTVALRMEKSENEIAIIQYAMNITLEVQKRVRDYLQPGMSSHGVIKFIDEEHHKLCGNGSSFAIVSFGKATAIPHGVEENQILQKGDAILIDTGTTVDGYHSDITRSYMLDNVTDEFAKVWGIEQQLQNIVFNACKLGKSAADVDNAGREALLTFGLGPDYMLPGIPHRIGHGLGLNIHEEPFISRHDHTILKPGMCFSNEPTLIYPDHFGIRLEDAIYMTAEGAKWFTPPAQNPTEI